MEFELWQLEEERRYLRAMAEGREWYEEGEVQPLQKLQQLAEIDRRAAKMA